MKPPTPVEEAIGAGVANNFRAGVRIGAYDGGGYQVLSL